MRSAHLILGTSLALLFSAPAMAADPGTYRPGAPYNSTQASGPEVCESQCSGDAQCKGWNFVRVNPQAPRGVCEFNSQLASPVPSAISVSGDNGSSLSGRTFSSGSTNTVRIGAPDTTKVIPARTTSARIPARTTRARKAPNQIDPYAVRPGARAIQPGQTAPRRQIVRKPVPNQVQPQGSAYRATNNYPQRQAISRPAPRTPFRHNLDESPRVPYQPAAPARPQMNRQQPQSRSGPPLPPPGYRPPPTGAQNPAATMGGDPRLQRMIQSQATRPTVPPAPQRTPNAQTPPSQQAMPPQPPARPQTLGEAEQSLFGSLHDDVQMPKPITQAEAANEDAPIATVQAVPAKRVTTENLMGLAGGPAR